MENIEIKENVADVDLEAKSEEPKIKVSVVMPIYNAFDYLRPALDSIIDQTLADIEIICIDDGSTDRSLDIVKKYQEADKRLRIVTENNAGVSTARNKGIVRAKGEYIIFLDADDFYEPTLLEKLYNTAVEKELDIAFTKFDIYNNKSAKFSPAIEEDHGNIFDGGVVISKNEFPDCIFLSTTGYVWNKMFKTSFIKEKELTFAPELYIFEDVHFVCSALSLAERVARVDEILIHHRVYSEQSRAKLFRKYYNHVPTVYLKIKEQLSHYGMYIPLSVSYLNLSASRCYKIYNLLWNDGKEEFWNLLHSGYADALGWFRHAPSDFENLEVYDFVANVGLYTHEQYEARLKKGKTLDAENLQIDELNKKIKNAKFKEKFSFKIFGKKK